MQCPNCQYVISDFDIQCARCGCSPKDKPKRKPRTPKSTATPPVVPEPPSPALIASQIRYHAQMAARRRAQEEASKRWQYGTIGGLVFVFLLWFAITPFIRQPAPSVVYHPYVPVVQEYTAPAPIVMQGQPKAKPASGQDVSASVLTDDSSGNSDSDDTIGSIIDSSNASDPPADPDGFFANHIHRPADNPYFNTTPPSDYTPSYSSSGYSTHPDYPMSERTVHVRSYWHHDKNGGESFTHSYMRSPPHYRGGRGHR